MTAYVLADIDVTDPARYADYKALAGPSVEQYGGRYAVRGGTVQVLEGDWPTGRFVVLEFPDGDHERLDVVRALQVSVALRDGLLDVHCLGDLPLRQVLAVERRRRAGAPVEHERVHRVTARSVRVVTTPSTDVSLDDGVETYTPITLTVQRGALRMLVP